MSKFSLYCITIFLSHDRLKNSVTSLETCGVQNEKRSVADQTGEICASWHANAGGVPLVLAPCNDFHYDGDYEIGLTVKSRTDWEPLLSEAASLGLALETGTDVDGVRYAIPKASHGPFFILDDVHDNHDTTAPALFSLRATMIASDAELYESCIRPLLEPTLSDSLHISIGERFELQELRVEKWIFPSSPFATKPQT